MTWWILKPLVLIIISACTETSRIYQHAISVHIFLPTLSSILDIFLGGSLTPVTSLSLSSQLRFVFQVV